MSAIVGIVHKHGYHVSKEATGKMLQAIADRGNKKEEILELESVTFAKKLLAVVQADECFPAPLVCKESGLVLVADARIDNRDELAEKLNLSKAYLKKISDDHLLLHAFKKWKKNTPQHLLGDFVFAIWDKRNSTLFCCRDRLGVKPFFYFDTPNLFAFSSEIKALLVLKKSGFQINTQTVAAYVLRTVHDAEETFYSSIQRLLPGRTLEVRPEGINQNKYWSPFEVNRVTFQHDDQYGEAFREIFQRAVKCRLRSDTPIGATLSGGLDSSSIVCTGAELLQNTTDKLYTYSAVFPNLPAKQQHLVNEEQYRKAVLEKIDSNSCLIEVDGKEIFNELPNELKWIGSPFINPNLYIHRAIYRQAAKDGVRVLLDGIDGDTVVSHGYELFPHLLLKGKWKKFISEILAIKKVSGSQQGVLRLATRYGVKPILKRFAELPFIQSSIEMKKLRSCFTPDFIDSLNWGGTPVSMKGLYGLPVFNAQAHHQVAMDQPYLMYALETSNMVASRYSIEERYPFLDSRVVEFCLGIPPEVKFGNGWSRLLLRSAMSGTLPQKVQTRLHKANLSPAFFNIVADQGEKLIKEVLEHKQNNLIDFFLASYLEHLLKSSQVPQRSLDIYTVVCVSLWLRDFPK